MITLKGKTRKLIAAGLVLVLGQVYVQADLVRTAPARFASVVRPQTHQGRLTTRGNNPVMVNGNSAKTGETIFSGQRIQTPAGVGATIDVPGLGSLHLAPDTNVTLTFEGGKINVNVASGCVILTADRGTAGTVEAGGSTQQTDQANGGSVDVCAARTAGGTPVVGQGAAAAAGAGAGGGAATASAVGGAAGGGVAGGAAGGAGGAGGLFGMGTAATMAFMGAAAMMTAAAVVAPCRRGRNPSPGTPRGRNDECRQ